MEIVIDTSVVIAFTFPDEEYNAKARGLISQLAKQSARLYAPVLWESETDSVIRLKESTGKLTRVQGDAALRLIDALGVEVVYLPSIRQRARMLGRQLNVNRVCDCTYAALSQIRGCDFWTADKRFYNVAKSTFKWVRHIDEIAL